VTPPDDAPADISTVEGRTEVKQEMIRTLLHHMQLEKRIGDIEETADSRIMAQARLSRKQYQEKAELVLGLLKELEG